MSVELVSLSWRISTNLIKVVWYILSLSLLLLLLPELTLHISTLYSYFLLCFNLVIITINDYLLEKKWYIQNVQLVL